MRIGILSNRPKCYSTIRLKNAARSRGHTVRVLGTSSFSLDIKSGKPDLLYKGKPLSRLDAIIPRVAASSNIFGTAVIRQFEQMGIYSLNPSFAVSVARDKLRSMQILSRHQIGIPPSSFAFDKSDIEPALKRIGGAPAVIKLLEGSQGAGVMLADSVNVAKSIIEALQVAGHNVLIQKFIAESKGKDIRAFVVGDQVIAAMRRTAQDGEFRSNVHLGASVEEVQLDPEFERVAIHGAHIMGLRVAGVDLLESNDGPQILEINACPGLEGIEAATRRDLADYIISYLEEQIQFPDVDIRQRLALGKGYGVVEIPIVKGSILADKEIRSSTLPELEVLVLSITRGSVAIPSPRSSEILRSGDTLLCYGKQTVLKNLLPKKKERKRRIKSRELSEEAIQATQEVVNGEGSEDFSFSGEEALGDRS